MKKVIFILLCSCPFFFACRQGDGNDIPAFNLLLADSSTLLNTGSIPSGKPIVMLYFSPDCEHCQAETEGLLKYMDALKDVRFYFVTTDPFDRLKVFNEYFRMDRHPNITLGRDYAFFMPKYFEINQPPYMLIYNKYKKLEIIFDGEVKVNEIIAEINKISTL